MNWFTNLGGAGTTTGAGNRGPTAMNGNAVMYEAGKILAVGGAPSFALVHPLPCLRHACGYCAVRHMHDKIVSQGSPSRLCRGS